MRSTLREGQKTTQRMRRRIGLPVYLLAALLSISTLSEATSSPFTSPADNTLYRLAEQNDAAAQYLIGRKYYTGNEVAKDINEAIKWFEMAAKQNHIRAQ